MLKETPLHQVHLDQHAKMCEFANYEMPIQYSLGVLKEHEWVREHAGMFDVSHMGQAFIEGADVAEYLSHITPSDFIKAEKYQAKYTVLTNENGGIIDDLIITRLEEEKFFLVYNAARKEVDEAWVSDHLPEGITFTPLADRALIALQGPSAQDVLAGMLNDSSLIELAYMQFQFCQWQNQEIFVSRLGYTGEDGFEISVPADLAPAFWNALAENEEVEPVGLAARDSLRLEMGYPLYGDDLNEQTTPIAANLAWVVSKANDNFLGYEAIAKERELGPEEKRVGIELLDKGVARKGSPIVNTDGEQVGVLTSGGFSPSLKQSIGQGYIKKEYAEIDKELYIDVRGRKLAAKVHAINFIAPKTKSMKRK